MRLLENLNYARFSARMAGDWQSLDEETTLGSAPPVSAEANLTRHEWSALQNPHNLADGHARQGQGEAGGESLDRLGELYREAEQRTQLELQHEFEAMFYVAAGQPSVLARERRPLHHYSSSLSIEVVANHLRATGARVGLLHPTFDNIPAILRRLDVPLKAISEAIFENPRDEDQYVGCDAIFLVMPNNPTGFVADRETMIAIAEHCAETGRVLIVDQSFRFFSPVVSAWDLYQAFEEIGLEYVGIEDTGKTWPTLDLKVGSLVCSDDLYDDLQRITDDCLLNVSAFIFALLREYIVRDDGSGSRAVALANRRRLRDALAATPVEMLGEDGPMSVAWLRLPQGWKSSVLAVRLAQHGISVLPGGPFFWADSGAGEPFVRAALMRPEADFGLSADFLADALLAVGEDAMV